MEEMALYSYAKANMIDKIKRAEEAEETTFLMGGFPRQYIEAASKAIKNYEVTVVKQSPIGLDFEIRFIERPLGVSMPSPGELGQFQHRISERNQTARTLLVQLLLSPFRRVQKAWQNSHLH